MRPAPITVLALSALLACSDVVGADFDRPTAESSPARDGGAGDPSTTVDTIPLLPGGECPPLRKRCGEVCARVDDPKFGCGAESCAACPESDGAVASCSSALACGLSCLPGFAKRTDAQGDRCVGFRVEKSGLDMAYALTGSESDLFVATLRYGVPGSPESSTPRFGLAHRDAAGAWSTENLPTSRRLITGLSLTPGGDLYAGTSSTADPDPDADPTRSLLHRSPAGVWERLAIGESADTTSIRAVLARSPNDIFVVVDDGSVRHFENGTWTAERTGAANGSVSRLWAPDAEHLFLVAGRQLFLRSRPTPDGLWSEVALRSDVELHAIHGTQANDFYVSGERGLLSHVRNFHTITKIPTDTTEDLRGLWVAGPNDVWAAGGNLILHATDDSRTEREPSWMSGRFASIWGSRSDDLFVAGATGADTTWSGIVLRRH